MTTTLFKTILVTLLLIFGTGSLITAVYVGIEGDWFYFTFAIFISFMCYLAYTLIITEVGESK